jgi:1-acyl-sn-glycerol-3-phosphate acyltransferase
MPQQRYFADPYRFVPPYRRQVWCKLASLILPSRVRKQMGVTHWSFRGLEHLRESLKERRGILLTPNHSRIADSGVLGMLSIQLKQYFYFVVSAHMFRQSRWQRWYLNRLGCFSILREGSDHEAIRACTRILADADRPLVVFPEGTWFRQNDRLGPLQEGVGLIARHAAKTSPRPVVVHPIAIKYWSLGDPTPLLRERLARLERQFSWKPQEQLDLVPRIQKLTSAYVALKEVEFLGKPHDGGLDERIRRLGDELVSTVEERHGAKPPADALLLERIRLLRQRLVRKLQDADSPPTEKQVVLDDLDILLFCENLSAHDQEYLLERPCNERLIEAVQRLEETVHDAIDRPIGSFGAVVEVGPAIDVKNYPRPKPSERANGDPLVKAIGTAIQGMLDRILAEGPPAEWTFPKKSLASRESLRT